MAACQWALLNKLQPNLDTLPDMTRGDTSVAYQETLAESAQQMPLDRHTMDYATKSIATAVIIQHIAWFRLGSLAICSQTEDLSIDGEGLFHNTTDEIMNYIQKRRTTAK
ncbi:hypothetical protein JRQ81_014167 [Phrynocephalus forsythii]|uniref:Uncharacterized protein n=1 Tax=Phrynocephalus forsythii TaxID=171643 RepID=A0A9Q0XWT3_9SAUR|nr:hypothetical protein JRQ81_014167 [Phrynocephalus forsythii]